MNTSITVLNSQVKTMSSREIAEITEKQHPHVCRDIRKMLVQIYGGEEAGYAPEKILKNQRNPYLDAAISVTEYGINSNGSPLFEYLLDKTHTYTLVAGYRADLRFKIIQRWQELEVQAANGAFLVPKTFSEALRLAADQAQQIEEQQHLLATQQSKIEQDKPKVEFYDDVADAATCHSMREAAQLLGTGQNRLFAQLRDEGVLSKNNLPMQAHVDAGHFRLVERVHRNPKTGEAMLYSKTLVTGKGVQYLKRKFYSTSSAALALSGDLSRNVKSLKTA